MNSPDHLFMIQTVFSIYPRFNVHQESLLLRYSTRGIAEHFGVLSSFSLRALEIQMVGITTGRGRCLRPHHLTRQDMVSQSRNVCHTMLFRVKYGPCRAPPSTPIPQHPEPASSDLYALCSIGPLAHFSPPFDSHLFPKFSSRPILTRCTAYSCLCTTWYTPL